MKPTSQPKPGEERLIQSFDIRISTLNEATFDILFSRDEVILKACMKITLLPSRVVRINILLCSRRVRIVVEFYSY
jgi:hypothetical protein